MRILILTIAGAAFFCASQAKATVFFDDTFESTLVSSGWTVGSCDPQDPNWATHYANGCNALRSTELPHAGSYSLRGDYAAGCFSPNYPWRTCGAFYDRTFPVSTDVYVRFYYRTTGFTYDASRTKHFYLTGNAKQYPDVVVTHAFGSREMTVDMEVVAENASPCLAAYSSCWYPANSAHVLLNDGQWYCVETHVKYNTPTVADGMLELWVNGTQTHNYRNRTFRGPNVSNPNLNTSNAVMNRVRLFVQAGSGLMYYDDFAIGNTRIGCGGGQQTLDTTPPSLPAGLRVQ